MKTVFLYLIIFTTMTAIFPTHTMDEKPSDKGLILVPLKKISKNNDIEISLETSESLVDLSENSPTKNSLEADKTNTSKYHNNCSLPLPATNSQNIMINQSNRSSSNLKHVLVIPLHEKKDEDDIVIEQCVANTPRICTVAAIITGCLGIITFASVRIIIAITNSTN